MPKLIPAVERIARARKLIQQARELPVPTTGLGKSDFSYIANVKDLMRQAKDLIKFIPQTAGVSAEMKEEVKKVHEEIEQAIGEILRL
jgi:2-keto-3-deoxy-L-rhamnonate aldolase RhmA